MRRWVRSSTSFGGALQMEVHGAMTYDGHMDFSVTLLAVAAVSRANITLGVPVAKDLVRFAVGAGMGSDGGYFPRTDLAKLNWRWMSPTPAPNPNAHPPGARANGQGAVGTGWRVWLGVGGQFGWW